MFWGVTLEPGKRYSQVVDSSYHLSMAALEPLPPGESHGSSKFVSVMIEHNKSEYLLCTLEQNKILQVNLDHCFVEGEEVTYFITGEGTVHLTGYIITDGIEGEEESDESEENDVSVKPTKMPMTINQHDSDDSDDENDEDWKPGMKTSKSWPTLPNSGSAKSKTPPVFKNQMPKVKPEKTKNDEKNSEQNSSPKADRKRQKEDLEKPALNKASSDDDDDEDDEEDDDFLMGGDEDDSEEDSDEEEQNSDWESAEDDDDDDDEPPKHVSKKAKVEGNGQKAKSVSPDTSVLSNSKRRDSSTPSVFNKSQEEGSSKKKRKQLQSEDTPQSKNAATKGSPGAASKSSSESASTPQSSHKARKSFGGVEIKDVVTGNGPPAKQGKMVHVYYRGTLPNNKVFDSHTKGKAFSFRLGKSEVIKGWDVGIQGMKVGGKRKLVIPPSMGYGNRATGPIPPNSTLHFEVELKAVS